MECLDNAARNIEELHQHGYHPLFRWYASSFCIPNPIDVLASGLAESTFYPAIQYVIGSWYKGEELGKRACIFHVRFIYISSLPYPHTFSDCQRHWTHVQWLLANSALSLGKLSAVWLNLIICQAAYNGLNGVYGLAGWKCRLVSQPSVSLLTAHHSQGFSSLTV